MSAHARITIDGLLEEFARATADARELVAAVPADQFNWKATPQRWSVGECLEHLILTNEKYHRRLQRVLSEANLPPGREAWGTGLVGGIFLRMMEPPVRKKVAAPAVFRPEPSHLDPSITLERFEDTQRRLAGLLGGVRGRDMGRLKVASPVSKWLEFSVPAAFAIIVSHERRHLWQARQIINEME